MKTNSFNFLPILIQIITISLIFANSNSVFGQNEVLNGTCNLNRAIPDRECLVVPIIVNNAPGTALGQDVFLKEIRLIIRHSWRNDLEISLRSPDSSVTVQLINERGGSSDNFGDIAIENCGAPIILTNSTCALDSVSGIASSTFANDGVTDCEDICPNGDDTINTDNAGMPDACDCNPNDSSDEFIIENGNAENILNAGNYQASFSLSSKGIVSKDTIIIFRAGAEISLLSGFFVEAGGQFLAAIEACTPSTLTTENIAATERMEEDILLLKEESLSLIDNFQISPNPFANTTIINYNLTKDTKVNLQIFSLNGRLIKELVPQQWQSKGNYEYIFEPITNAGNIYYAVLITENSVKSKKMIFIR